MEGITILSEQIARDCPIGCFVILCILSICVCGLAGMMLLVEWDDANSPLFNKILMSIAMAVLIFILVFGLIQLSSEMQPYTKYQITIDDTVGFNAFHSQYEILHQVGQVFTVRLKEVLS